MISCEKPALARLFSFHFVFSNHLSGIKNLLQITQMVMILVGFPPGYNKSNGNKMH